MDNYSNLLMDECPPDLRSPEDEFKPAVKKAATKGIATSFGFRKRPITAPSSIQTNNSHEPFDNNGNNDDDTEPLTTNMQPTSRSATIHRLPPPKKEAAATKVSRFGFRQPNANRLNRIADININPPSRIVYGSSNNNNDLKEREKIQNEIKAKVEMHNKQLDSNKNRPVGKYTLHTQHLPRPQLVKIPETKTAKTLANNNRKQFFVLPSSGDSEDSGMGSTGHVDKPITLDHSPKLRSRNKIPRSLEVVMTGHSKFDVKDCDDARRGLAVPSLPNMRHNFGLVHKRTEEYQKQIDIRQKLEARQRRVSLTSSEASSHCDESVFKNEKVAKFLKTPKSAPPAITKKDSCESSEETCAAGEAMADFATPNSQNKSNILSLEPHNTRGAIHSLISSKFSERLSLVHPEFAAVAAVASSTLLTDETSPVDSVITSISDHSAESAAEIKEEEESKKVPGSPTNNSLSLSDNGDGRDDFLIDDEIADQPALLFDDTLTNKSISHHSIQETIIVPKTKPSVLMNYEGSPLLLRNKKLLNSRTGSLDTLSPCESIASDDCMMDYDVSSEMDDANNDRTNQSPFDIDDVEVPTLQSTDLMRNWSSLLNGCDVKDTPKRLALKSTSRLLKSRGGTPTSGPGSPRLDSRKASQNSLRISSRSSTGTGYDSDDSAIRVDRAHHCAMQQDVLNIKAMLLKLRRVVQEPANEEILFKSDTCNSLDNGFFNGSDGDLRDDDCERQAADELSDLKRQVLFLQGQLEDRDRIVRDLKEQMDKLVMSQAGSQSAPASINQTSETITSNAATQTERVRPISVGPLPGAANDLSPGSLVSASEMNSTTTKARGVSSPPQKNGRLWRTPGEPPSPSSIPRRSCSRSRLSSATVAVSLHSS